MSDTETPRLHREHPHLRLAAAGPGGTLSSRNPLTSRPWEDSVARLKKLRAANPDMTAAFDWEQPIWTGTLIVDGEQLTFTDPELAGLLDQLDVPAARRRQELERLAHVWGDWYEAIRVDSNGRWAARQRTGDGLDLAAVTADELDALLRKDCETQEPRSWPA